MAEKSDLICRERCSNLEDVETFPHITTGELHIINATHFVCGCAMVTQGLYQNSQYSRTQSTNYVTLTIDLMPAGVTFTLHPKQILTNICVERGNSEINERTPPFRQYVEVELLCASFRVVRSGISYLRVATRPYTEWDSFEWQRNTRPKRRNCIQRD